MIINRISLENFRNYHKETISFSEGINFIVGDNGQGKTNLLEGIYYTINASSFKTSKDEELINTIAPGPGFSLCLDIIHNQKKNQVLFEKKGSTKSYRINGIKRPLKNDRIKTVLFIPDDLRIIKEGPGMRREFLDGEIGMIFANYRELQKQYQKLLLQKNHLLKKNPDSQLLRIFNHQLQETGGEVIRYRLQYLQEITPIAREVYRKIAEGKETLTIHYKPSFQFQKYAEELEANLQEEIQKKQAIIGPHRDDLVFYLDQKNARTYGSQGQQRSIILAIKIAELQYLRKFCEYYPILLLDDVFSELDEKRKKMLMETLRQEKIQSFITLANEKMITPFLFPGDRVIRITRGRMDSSFEK